jgi:hypothetical protein
VRDSSLLLKERNLKKKRFCDDEVGQAMTGGVSVWMGGRWGSASVVTSALGSFIA